MTEASATRQLMRVFRDMGAWPIKLNDATRGGLPDLLVLRRDGSLAFVEVKKRRSEAGMESAQLSAVQRETLNALAGRRVAVFMASVGPSGTWRVRRWKDTAVLQDSVKPAHAVLAMLEAS